MKTLNEMKCTFPARSENESFARTMVCAFAAQLDPTVEELADLRTAVSEAVTNSIVHAYRGISGGSIAVTVRLLPDSVIYVRIADKGCGIADIEKAMEPLYSSAPAEERAGLGFTVMESFTDKLQVSSKVGIGTTVIMRKKMRHGREYDCH
ncbi:MAG: anti-sigma F factor [Oscillospiraceae bacterium]|jgi:stage II sporulation protein AB (anti-sigma F factor)|nr:anti-sigma F factor [Oscillospiraceae bacterium]